MPASPQDLELEEFDGRTVRIGFFVDVSLAGDVPVSSAMLNVPMNALIGTLCRFNLVDFVQAVRFEVDGVPRLIFQ